LSLKTLSQISDKNALIVMYKEKLSISYINKRVILTCKIYQYIPLCSIPLRVIPILNRVMVMNILIIPVSTRKYENYFIVKSFFF